MCKHTTPNTRKCITEAVRRIGNKSLVARVFGVTRTTVSKWCQRAFHRGYESFEDRRPEPKKRKITEDVEKAILAMRTLFEWGTARIQQGLDSLPKFAEKVIMKLVGTLPKIKLSRTSINGVLQEHNLNGYSVRQDNWKFFRAERPDELWQLDLKGPFRVQGKKYWIVVCIDDYSRYFVLCELFESCPTTNEIGRLLENYCNNSKKKPEKILTDRGTQFQDIWKHWCKLRGIEPIFAHPHYPQDKGKVERSIRNIAEEFVKLLKRFPEWLNELAEYKRWYNEERLHRGVGTVPILLYTCQSV